MLHGSASGGLCCRDYDELDAYHTWARTHPELADTLPTVETHRGRHVYFRGPACYERFKDGEYRGTPGQYTVLPPSQHPSGSTYRWDIALPDGDLPLVVDPVQAGLCNRAGTADISNVVAPSAVSAVSALLTPSSLPALLHDAETAIKVSLPMMAGQRNTRIFKLARHLKAIPSLRNADARTLRPIVEEWHRQALVVIGTKAFVETWADFLQAWKRVKVPADEGAIEIAYRSAVATAPPTMAANLYGGGPIVLLASICRELQRITGNCEFYLDCRTAGRLINVDHTTAWRYLDVLCADGVLVAGTKGTTRKSSRFRYIAELNCLNALDCT